MERVIDFPIAVRESCRARTLFVQVGALVGVIVGASGLFRWAFARMRAKTLDLV